MWPTGSCGLSQLTDGGEREMVPMPKKDITEYGGLKLDGPVLILSGPNTPKVEEVRKLGQAGFYVKERVTAYFWVDIGVTWKPV